LTRGPPGATLGAFTVNVKGGHVTSADRRVLFGIVLLLVAGSVVTFSHAASGDFAATVLVQANDPTMFTVAPDGRIWYSERTTGRISVFNPADGSSSLYFTVPNLCTAYDQGLYGLALHPAFPNPATVYSYATRIAPDGSCHNQVLRLDAAGGGPTLTVLIDDPYTGGHIGGRIRFGPDGDLYVSSGDGSSPAGALSSTPQQERANQAQAQDTAGLKGKVLRITPDGGVPVGNPFGNATFAYGFRNPFGFDFDPLTGRLWDTDNSPEPDFPGDPAGPGPNGAATTR
jgi:glucose/arabinose dehydrogenase